MSDLRTPSQVIASMSFENIVENILGIFDSAGPVAFTEGQRWYDDMQAVASDLSARFNVSVSMAVGVLAVTSPMVSVQRNIIMATRILEAVTNGENPTPETLALGLYTNVQKGIDIANGDFSSLTWKTTSKGIVTGSQKVPSFFWNILGDEHSVTIDVWATRLALGESVSTQPASSAYRTLVEAYRAAAERRDVTPRTMQATVWIAGRGAAW